jgi:hypothetical protein
MPYHISGIRGLEKLESRSSTHNSRVARSTCAKAWLWSYGDVRIAPSVKSRRVGFYEGTVDWIRDVPIGIRGSRFSSRRI